MRYYIHSLGTDGPTLYVPTVFKDFTSLDFLQAQQKNVREVQNKGGGVFVGK